MKKRDAHKRIEMLRMQVIHHNEQYHTHDTPEISDEAYDALVRELGGLEESYPEFTSPDSPTKQVGGKILDGFVKTRHLVPQWSYDNVFGLDELQTWDERNRKILDKAANSAARGTLAYCCELKIDGLKIVLTYNDGILITGATRGDGTMGEDITENVRMVQSIPQTISDKRHMVVIGEIWMSKSDLATINADRAKLDLSVYANPRNLAAGTLRQLDTSVVASRDLQVFCYDIDIIDTLNNPDFSELPTHTTELVYLKKLGFPTNTETKTVTSLEAVQQYVDDWTAHRYDQEYGIDGVVIKLDDVTLRSDLGYTAKSPRFGVAYKFPAEEVTTVVENIDIQVGRTGVLTPVAHVHPVQVAGSIVARATLHNQDEIDRLDVRVGDTVILRKAGDIIPEILQVLTDLRPKGTRKFVLPDTCPVCAAPAARRTGATATTVAIYCTNRHCPAQSLENLIHFASKKAMNIVGMGQKIVEKLFTENLIQTPVDIYHLKKSDLEILEKFGELSASNLIESIEASKRTTLARFLFALGIHHIGEETAELITQVIDWRTTDELITRLTTITDDDLITINGIGTAVAESFVDYMNDLERQQVVRDLLHILTIEPPKHDTKKTIGKLTGKTFVITGTLNTMSRDDARARIKEQGGKVSSSVSKNTDYVVVGAEPGSKYDDALRLDVQILDETAFVDILQ